MRYVVLAATVLCTLTACHGGGGGGFFDAGGDAAGSDAAGGDGVAGTDTTQAVPAPLIDPSCVDGQYTETFPDVSADISGLIAGFDASDAKNFLTSVLNARYPVGGHIVANAPINPNSIPSDCWDFLTQTGSAAQVIDRAGTMVHECGHFLDGSLGSFSTNGYFVTTDLTLTCAGGDARERFGNTFARSLINGDSYAPQLPADFYKDTYLSGSPTNNLLESGDQGFNSLMEEASQYVNSLATAWALLDQQSQFRSTTARDGALTFQWYVARYLRRARLEDPTAYDFIVGDPCWREFILTTWGRAWLYLDATRGMGQLGISDDEIEPLVRDQTLIDEIDLVRQAHGCP